VGHHEVGGTASLWAARPWAPATSVGKRWAVGRGMEPGCARAISCWPVRMGLEPIGSSRPHR
jgi:hypothetical protein